MHDFVLETYDNSFPQELIDIFLQYNNAQMWGMRDGYFYNDLNDIDFFTKTCIRHIDKLTGYKHELVRCYRHALSSEKPRNVHYDQHNPSNRTFLVYMHPYWDILWGGQIRVGENLETQIDCLPNRSVYFSAEHNQHYVCPFKTEKFRVSYVWKLQTV